MLQNVLGGVQGIVDHVMVGNFVGYEGNAAVGVSWQIYIVVMVFMSSLYTGMAVLVARFAGANDPARVQRSVAQGLLTVIVLSAVVLAPLGWWLAPSLLRFVNATAEVRAQALPYLRIVFVLGGGMMILFMLSSALRSAGDARTPMRLGIAATVLNMALNALLIPGVGPIPRLGTAGAALGTVLAAWAMAAYALRHLFRGDWVVRLPHGWWRPDFSVIRALFRFGLPAGIQGVIMNVAGVFLLRFIGSLPQSAAAQAAYAVGYTELFSLVTWTSVGLMGAVAAVAGQNLGAGRPERVMSAMTVATRIGLTVAAVVGLLFLAVPRLLLGAFGMTSGEVVEVGVQLLRFLAVSGCFVSVALVHTGGLQGTGDTESPLYISIVSQVVVPLGLCAILQSTDRLVPAAIWSAILAGHFTRSLLSVWRFRQGRWRHIEVHI
jgi:putative MATE family efflux protein